MLVISRGLALRSHICEDRDALYNRKNSATVCSSRSIGTQSSLPSMLKLKTIEKTSAAKKWLQSHESDKANVFKTELTERSVLKIEKLISME